MPFREEFVIHVTDDWKAINSADIPQRNWKLIITCLNKAGVWTPLRYPLKFHWISRDNLRASKYTKYQKLSMPNGESLSFGKNTMSICSAAISISNMLKSIRFAKSSKPFSYTNYSPRLC